MSPMQLRVVRRNRFLKLAGVSENFLPAGQQPFEELVDPLRKELLAHCYRLLGSYHDAEDALQDALLRGWRGFSDFQGRSSFRTWMYTICTRTSLDIASAKGRRALPADLSPASTHAVLRDAPSSDVLWLTPFPSSSAGSNEPEGRYEQREALELAFIATLQHLPGNQRAALVLFDVVGFSAQEIAQIMDTSIDSVSSALARARKHVSERAATENQHNMASSMESDEMRSLVTQFAENLEARNVSRLLSLLAKDVTWSMPPLPHWYQGIDSIEDFVKKVPFGECGSWRYIITSARRPTRNCLVSMVRIRRHPRRLFPQRHHHLGQQDL